MIVRRFEKECENCRHWRCKKSDLPCRNCVGHSLRQEDK